ncbi:MAG: MFS transporter [Cyanobacteriota bacterium]|nr:MFS transporter [Cyanobacteriota bacterium]
MQVWLMSLGRLLSQVGTGFTLFFASIYFVNQVGLSATQVGLGLGLMALTGILGRLAGGSLSDGAWGRKPTLLAALLVSATGALALAFAQNFVWFLVANGIAGLGQGLYWPPAEAIVADLITREQRNEAFALSRLGDNLGNSIGVALAGLLVAATGAFRALFIIDALTFLVFAGLVVFYIRETRSAEWRNQGLLAGWKVAFSDRYLLIFAAANIVFTTYISQLSSSLPLYLNNQVGLSQWISLLFTLHGLLIALLQLPVARWLNGLTRIGGLQISLLGWGLGFAVIGGAGVQSYLGLGLAGLGLVILSLALVFYNPSASSLVVDLAPEHLRGVYLSVNSLCWAVGYGIGPVIGGMVLDLPDPWQHSLWLIWMVSTLGVAAILQGLARILPNGLRLGLPPLSEGSLP